MPADEQGKLNAIFSGGYIFSFISLDVS